MKPSVFVSAFALCSTIWLAVPAHGMGGRPAKFSPEAVSSMKVYEEVRLTDETGQPVALLADEWRELAPGESQMPSPSGDRRLCGTMSSTDRLLKQSEALLAVSHIYTSLHGGYPRALTPEQVRTIRRTPDCEPFSTFLSGIAGLLADQGSRADRLRLVRAQPKQVQSVELGNDSRGGTLRLSLVSGRTVLFRLAEPVEESVDRVPYNFHKPTAPAQTGQGYGVAISTAGYGGGERESEYTSTESCTVTERATVCRNGRCEEITVTREGTREVRNRSRPETTTYALSLTNAGNETAAVLYFDIYDPNRSEEKGPCIAHGGSPWDHGRDGWRRH